MVFFQARYLSRCARAAIVASWAVSAAIGYAQNAPGPLVPGQVSQQPGQNQPGQGWQWKHSRIRHPTPKPDANQQPQLPIVFQSHGLEYDALTQGGITVMFAQLPSRLREFNIVQVTVTNGSLVTWTVRATDFTFVRSDGGVYNPVSPDEVVANLLHRADRDDVIKLQLLYENSIYGLSNFRSTNGYEKRRESAMAEFVNRGLKAAVEASAIALVGTRLKSGESTDGAIFFENHTKQRSLGPGRLVAHTCGQTFTLRLMRS